MKQFLKENGAIMLYSTGFFSASLVIGLVLIYGLDNII